MKKTLLLTMFFLLLCLGGNAQFSENFENGIPSTWTTFKTLNGALTTAPPVPGWVASTQAANVCNGTTSAFITAQNIGAGNTSEGWLVTEQILVPANGLLQFTSKRSATQVYPTRYIVKVSTTSQTDIASFTDTILDYGQSDIASAPNNCVEHGIAPQIDLHDYVGQNIYIAFIKRDTQPTGVNIPNNDRWILDDVKVIEECMVPTNVQSVSQSETANLTWNANGANTWQVAVVTGAGMPNDFIVDYTTTTNSVQVTGLSPLSTYTYYIRAICDDSNSAWVGPFTITTGNCGAASQCLYTFVMTDTFGDGWNGNTMTITQNGVTVQTITLTSGYTGTVTVGLCDNTPFTIRWNTGGNWPGEVGIRILDPFGEEVYYKAPGVSSQGNNLYTGAVNCTPPTCPKPLNITVNNITQNTALLGWDETGGATQWEYVILPAGTPVTGATVFTLTDQNPLLVQGLEGGTNYVFYVRAVCSEDDRSNISSQSFTTAPSPPISVSTTQYTVPQLVEEVLIGTDCAEITNVTWRTGTNFNSSGSNTQPNGIGYFEKNGSNFPFQDGIVLSTGNAMSARGPKGSSTQSSGTSAWPGDSDLSALLAANGITGTLNNATVLEFDFKALSSSMSFDFIFASEEYGTFQCSYSDVFAFLLTDLETGVTTNLAVVPGTNIPISVTTIRNSAHNSGCASQNPQYFGIYYNGTNAASASAAINFRGQTVPLTAFSEVTPGKTYHIKLAIADYSDSSWDSAVFLLGGSFNLGEVDLGVDLLVETNNAICGGDEYLLESGLDDEEFIISWFLDGELIEGATSANLLITEPGEYTIIMTVEGATCGASDSVVVEFYNNVEDLTSTPSNLTECTTSEDFAFDLTQNAPVILDGLDATEYELAYYLSYEDAESANNHITNPESYTNISNPQTIYVFVENIVTGCTTIKSFQLFITEYVAPVIDFEYDSVSYCLGGSSPVITLGSGFTHIGEFSSTPSGLVLDATTGVITLSGSLPGTYTITYTVGSNACDTGLTHSEEVTLLESGVVDLGFSYDALEYCTNASDPVITLSGGFTGNGLFSATPSGLSIDATSGAIDLSASQAGAYEVVYTVNDVQCLGTVVSSPVSVTVHFSGTPNASFEYDSTSYCIAGANPVLNPSFTGGGEFSVSPSGLTIDSITGAIDLSTSTVGTYTITYEILPNGCNTGGSATYVITVTDLVAPQVNFSYVTSCVNSAVNPQVVTSGLTSGGLFSSTTLTVNPQTGEIDLSGATSGTHYVTYEVGVNGVTCTAYGTYTASIELTTELVPEVGFNYNSSYCYSDGSVLPDVALGFYYGGEFSSTGGLVINAQTGEINTGSSTPGTYVVTYTVLEDMSICNVGGSSQYTITIHGEFAVAISDECIGNVYWLHASAVNGSFDASTSTYTWVVNGNAVGYDSSFNVTEYLNGELLPSGGISVGVVVNNGCEGYAGFQVVSSSCITQKGISPNGDGQNDYFDLTGMGVRKLSIYNRYGREVYSRSNYEREWGGQDKNGNELPDGTYYYSIDKNDGTSSTGWIYINREY